MGDLHHHLSRLHHLAGLGADRRDRARLVTDQLGGADIVLRLVELRLCRIHLRLRRQVFLQRLIVADEGGEAAVQQRERCRS
ncbi:MAG: hypothetical protein U1E33_08080 [Rhodospirillales bacterium]